MSILDRSEPPKDLLALPTVKFFKTDITLIDNISAAVNGTVQWTSETKAALGGVINCAGVGVASKIIDARNQSHSLELWDFALAVNLTGTFNLTRLVLEHLIKVEPEPGTDGERGVVIFVASAAAVRICPSTCKTHLTSGQFEGQPGQTAYAATKGALVSMTLPMARDLSRHAIRVATIAPGVFDSSMTVNFPAKTRRSLENDGIIYPKRFGQPHEFARTVRFIIDCAYINGETIRLSGAGRLPGKL